MTNWLCIPDNGGESVINMDLVETIIHQGTTTRFTMVSGKVMVFTGLDWSTVQEALSE